MFSIPTSFVRVAESSFGPFLTAGSLIILTPYSSYRYRNTFPVCLGKPSSPPGNVNQQLGNTTFVRWTLFGNKRKDGALTGSESSALLERWVTGGDGVKEGNVLDKSVDLEEALMTELQARVNHLWILLLLSFYSLCALRSFPQHLNTVLLCSC